MPKQKTHKGISKRVHVTRRGKVVVRRSGKRHLASSKSRKRKRRLSRPAELSSGAVRRLKDMMLRNH